MSIKLLFNVIDDKQCIGLITFNVDINVMWGYIIGMWAVFSTITFH